MDQYKRTFSLCEIQFQVKTRELKEENITYTAKIRWMIEKEMNV